MQEFYAVLAEMAARGEPGAVATVIRTERSVPRHVGSKLLVRSDGSVLGSVGGGALEAAVVAAARQVIADGECRRLQFDLTGGISVCGGAVELFVEPLAHSTPLLVVGAGHVGRALLRLGAELPLHFTVVDDREPQLLDLEPARVLLATPAELTLRWDPTPRSVVVVASRHHDLDAEYLAAVFAAERRVGARVSYLGCVGSSAKARHLRQWFAARGEGDEADQRIVVPLGLAIGAETPAEIALSILAEVMAVIRGAAWLTDDAGVPTALWRQRNRPRSELPPAGAS